MERSLDLYMTSADLDILEKSFYSLETVLWLHVEN